MIKKILCSLIIGFGLFNFSSAYEVIKNSAVLSEIPEQFTVGDFSYNIDRNVDFNTSGEGNFLHWLTSNDSNNFNYIIGWIDEKLYFYSYNINAVAGYRAGNQGFFNSFCATDNITPNGDVVCSNFNISSQDFYNIQFNIDKIGLGRFFYSSMSSYGDVYDRFGICFYNTIDNLYYCAISSMATPSGSARNYISSLSGSVGFTSFEEAQNYSWSFSPFTSSTIPTIPDYEFNEDDDFTNRQIIEGYNAMGLTDEFCYGGFALDNIFEAGTVPEMFTGYRWGSGAFIFDIWNIYSGAYNNDYISFLRSFYISYENNNYSDFYGKTKAIYGFVNQWFSVSSKGLGFIEATAPTFTLVDVWQYCDIKFNQDPNAIYTGNRWDPKFRYYTSGQVNLGGYFNFSGNNNYFSGSLSGFNTPKDFFASLNAIFQGGLNNLEDREPVLPTYIIIFFLAIIFIRIISH